jgi:molecular chaperone DnaK
VYQTEKLLREQGEQMGEEKTKVEGDLQHLKDALGESDVDAIKRATEALGVTLQSVSQRLYEQASASSAGAEGAAAGDTPPADDDVVDAEIVDEGEQSA